MRNGGAERVRESKDKREREGLLSKHSVSLEAAFSATLPSCSNDLKLCQMGQNVCRDPWEERLLPGELY